MGGLASPDSDFKTFYKVSVMKNVLLWHQGRHTDQWDRIEGPDICSNIYVQLVFNQSTNTTEWGNSFLSAVLLALLDIHM